MKRTIITAIVIILSSLISHSSFSQQSGNKQLAEQYIQSKGEVYFSFELFDRARLQEISNTISIDNVNGNTVFAYANRKEFDAFLKFNIPYSVLRHPGDAEFDVKMSDDPSQILDWDYYPTYDAYVTMMNQFVSTYPNLCTIINGGQTVQGRAILFLKIKNNVGVTEARPKFLYTSSMHGDETTGYVLMLRLINYLLTNFGSDPKVTLLMNNIEIWINPLANPDGTYHGGNSTVNGAVRYNANNYDLNRNYPGVDGPNTQPIQPETQIFMNIATANNFSLSCNFHGGAEVVNYPWDSWSRLCTDDAWWIRASRQYADTVHAHAVAGYMTYLNNGITNGYAWYYVHGSRQDYQCYYRHAREVTIELSNTKLLPPTQLPAHWDYNYRSFLNYIQKVLYGVTGTVTDSVTGAPLAAKVFITGFDTDSSEVYSDSQFGKYYRLIIQGNYNITYSAPGYYSKTINGVHVINDSTTVQNVQLRPITTGIVSNGNTPHGFKLSQNYPNPFNPQTIIGFSLPTQGHVNLTVFDITGREVAVLVNRTLEPGEYSYSFNAENLSSGIYTYVLQSVDFYEAKKMVLLK